MQIETALGRIKTAVGPRGWIADPAEQEPYLVEARRLWHGATRLVVRPASTEEVAAVVRICAEAKLPIVPQGGNTGLVGGGVPPEDGTEHRARPWPHEPHPRHRPGQFHDDRRGRLYPRPTARGGRRG